MSLGLIATAVAIVRASSLGTKTLDLSYDVRRFILDGLNIILTCVVLHCSHMGQYRATSWYHRHKSRTQSHDLGFPSRRL